MNKVNCFLIGTQKGGTTALYSWLAKHPDIDAPSFTKDLHYFINKEALIKGVHWYEQFYKSGQAKVRLDASVNYLFRPEAAQKVFEYNPEAKIVLILRDPPKRAFSAYQFFYKLNLEKKEFGAALTFEQNGNLKIQEDRDDFAYIEHGFYYQQLNHWLRFFKRDQIMIVLYEQLFTSPNDYFPKLLKFLKVDETFLPQTKVKNRTGIVKYKWLNELVYNRQNSIRKYLVHNLGLKNLVPVSWRVNFLKNFRDWNTEKKSDPNKIRLEDYNRLMNLYKEDMKSLSNFLDEDLTAFWKY